jgi:hypothetical protein
MTTSSPQFRRRARHSALTLAISALCLPSSALAQGDTKDDYPGSAGHPRTTMSKIGDTPADFPGMPAHSVPANASPTPKANSFDWTSAAVGAGGAGLLFVVSLGGTGAASRVRMRTVRS